MKKENLEMKDYLSQLMITYRRILDAADMKRKMTKIHIYFIYLGRIIEKMQSEEGLNLDKITEEDREIIKDMVDSLPLIKKDHKREES